MYKIQNYKINIAENKGKAIQHFNLIVDLFSNLKIDYWIEYGTMLGAVRESGFIPWDSEFDVGMWNHDFLSNKDFLLKRFKEMGFHVNTSSKDRIKLLHKDLLIGAYTIDIHTYHIKDNTAYVSFNRGKKSFIEKVVKFLKKFDEREASVHPISKMIKTILKNGYSLPSEFYYTKLNYGDKFLYTIKFDNIILKEESPNSSSINRFTLGFISTILNNIPKGLLYSLIDSLSNLKSSSQEGTLKVQAIPLNYYKNLAPIKFENTHLNGPAESQKYIENIYGQDWHIGKPDWISTQNNINKNFDSI
ncbi:LicD family protein [Sphingobacterium sp. SGL-16]|uniref:LicD family protein n=1 Tax=Sphingobacterium sp. SGL-16 TaxID=2710883 RepID=UPI0013EA0F0B|nr:LicD family protein [Sphingobacterium sp. SGL-16]NGM73073.1 LicD family protein [Sphingobacterium sp. SGL-16]